MSQLSVTLRPSRLASLIESSVRRVFTTTVAPATAAVDGPDTTTAELALAEYAAAVDQARAADRTKRRAKKTIDTLSSGVYGAFRLTRKASSRKVLDTTAVAAFYALHGAELPMRTPADSVVVERI